MMADSSADTRLSSRCPFCLEDLTNMIQPKKLMCGHLYCLQCLQGHFSTQQELSCSFCGEQYTLEVADLESLPAPLDIDAEPAAKRLRKDDLLHFRGFSTHNDESENSLKILDDDELALNTSVLLCEDHDKEPTMCCKICYKQLCVNCSLTDNCKSAWGYADKFTPHQYLPIHDVASSVRSELSKLSKRLDAELESYAKEEKMAWLKEDDVEERCNRLTQYVTQVAARLIACVKEKEEYLKATIVSFKEKTTRELELCVSRITEKCDRLSHYLMKCHQMQREFHQTRLVKERTCTVSEIRDMLNDKIDMNVPATQPLEELVNTFSDIGTAIRSGLELQCEFEPDGNAYGSFMTKVNNELLVYVGCSSLMYQRLGDIEQNSWGSVPLKTRLGCLYELDGKIYFTEGNLDGEPNDWERVVPGYFFIRCADSFDDFINYLKSPETAANVVQVFRFHHQDMTSVIDFTLNVTEKFVFASFGYEMCVFNRKTGRRVIQHMPYLMDAAVTADGDLLVSSDEHLWKYEMNKDGELEVRWKSAESTAYAIESLPDGRILLQCSGGRYGGLRQHIIAIISPEGRTIHRLTDERFTAPGDYYSMVEHDGHLYLLGDGGSKLLKFRWTM